MFGEGISKTGEIVDLGVNTGVIKKSGSLVSPYNGSKLGQGREAVKRVIGDNPELAEELTVKIREVPRRCQTRLSTKAGGNRSFPPKDPVLVEESCTRCG